MGAIDAISAMLRITGRNPKTLHNKHKFHILRKRLHEQFHKYEYTIPALPPSRRPGLIVKTVNSQLAVAMETKQTMEKRR